MPLGVELDGVSLVGFSVLPAVVTVDIITWVVSVGLLTVQMYMQKYTYQISFPYVHYMLRIQVETRLYAHT